MNLAAPTVRWDRYARAYDAMADANPAYQSLLRRFSECATPWCVPSGGRIVDIGAGTGNFSMLAARRFPQAEILLCEPEAAMLSRARSKAQVAGITNVAFSSCGAEELSFPGRSIDGALLVHVLYTLSDPRALVGKLARWLRPGARAFVCDLGRRMDVADWRRYLLRHSLKCSGLIKTMRLMWWAGIVSSANREITAKQATGAWWSHDLPLFAEVFREHGFEVEVLETAYRGYSNLIVARA